MRSRGLIPTCFAGVLAAVCTVMRSRYDMIATISTFLFFVFFFIPFIILALLSPSLAVASQIRDHISGPPPPHYGTCLLFYREKTSAFSSLVDSGRHVPTRAARGSQL